MVRSDEATSDSWPPWTMSGRRPSRSMGAMTAPVQPSETVTTRATRTAATAAALAGVRIRVLDTVEEVKDAADLLAEVWQTESTTPPLNPDLMRAFSHVGNYVAGAYAGDALLGVSVGFMTGTGNRHLHSHISGVAPAAQGRSVGYALKLHQRAWALEQGLTEISWTVDPLVRRNIFFNLVKLRATVAGFLPNFYGAMADGINACDDSDRLMLSWRLTDRRGGGAGAPGGDRGARAGGPGPGGGGGGGGAAGRGAGAAPPRV